MLTLTQKIKTKARELGFCEVGIARAECLEEEGNRLVEWLSRGYHGTMRWMARNIEKRVDPRVILPGAASIISVALNYYADVPHSSDAGIGKISRYAWGDDYHQIMKEKLKQLLEYIIHLEQAAVGKVYVDTGPVLDKVWAQRAGVGWEGKHTNVITKNFGSWVFLGEIILNLELDYDPPAIDHCGTCTLCIEACPTDAIVEPYVLDSNRCISYLTIEHRGELNADLARNFENWIYGCDVCQDVCPWNKKFAQQTTITELLPHQYNVAPKLHEIVDLKPEEFSMRFRKSAVKRTKREGLKRNAMAVLNSNEVTVSHQVRN